jgi:hypothetical protein
MPQILYSPFAKLFRVKYKRYINFRMGRVLNTLINVINIRMKRVRILDGISYKRGKFIYKIIQLRMVILSYFRPPRKQVYMNIKSWQT